jgi:uncharacterized RDD family membrane protein YckC
MSKPPRPLDSRIEIVTPENIAFHYVLAGPFRRLPAFLIDLAIRAGLLFVIGLGCMWLFSLASATGLGLGVTLVSWFALSWFYGGFFETYWNGQTPGKRMLGLRVLTVDGQPINALQAVLRNVLRDVDSMPLAGPGGLVPLYTLALAVMAANDRYQRLGDLACGTIVVVEERSKLRELASLRQAEVAQFAQSLPLDFKVNRAMGQAIAVYVSRRELFSAERRFEIARTLAEPLGALMGLPGDTNPDLLLCALYYRTFFADRPGEMPSASGESRQVAVAAP